MQKIRQLHKHIIHLRLIMKNLYRQMHISRSSPSNLFVPVNSVLSSRLTGISKASLASTWLPDEAPIYCKIYSVTSINNHLCFLECNLSSLDPLKSYVGKLTKVVPTKREQRLTCERKSNRYNENVHSR